MTKIYGQPVPFTQVHIQDAFWTPRISVNREVTIPREYEMCLHTGRIEALKLSWKPGDQPVPHIFWDSDIAKWVEAASYSLASNPDPALDALLDEVTALIAASQQPDGYLNSHYTVVEPENRFTNLRDCHELYCAGHLIEAGVAHFAATGKRTLLDAVCHYADYIGKVFGRDEGQLRGYCGHEEIELALVKLSQVTGKRQYLALSSYFIEERGQEPNFFRLEAQRRGTADKQQPRDYSYFQAHLPVREQEQVTGHAVRAMYLYSAMADLARELDDPTLFAACDRLWDHLCAKQIYLTGGIGASRTNEGFLDEYDLPDASAYCETCAGIGLVFWAQRLLRYRCDRKYADILEKVLYNNVLAGASLDGRQFFYDNPLATYSSHKNRQGQITAEPTWYQRSDWFDCACCPPNYARLISSLGGYLYTFEENSLAVHLYIGSSTQLQLNGQHILLEQQTQYPWDGRISLRVTPEQAAALTIKLRIPSWCADYRVQINGSGWSGDGTLLNGYLPVSRIWQPGDELILDLDMPVRRIYAHPDIRYHNNCVATQRGPIVYCAEQADNAVPVRRIYLPADSELRAEYCADLLGGIVRISGEARAAVPTGAGPDSEEAPLYGSRPDFASCTVNLIPYYTWNNRQPGEMRVWLPEYNHT